jgi:hypothetical protein
MYKFRNVKGVLSTSMTLGMVVASTLIPEHLATVALLSPCNMALEELVKAVFPNDTKRITISRNGCEGCM